MVNRVCLADAVNIISWSLPIGRSWPTVLPLMSAFPSYLMVKSATINTISLPCRTIIVITTGKYRQIWGSPTMEANLKVMETFQSAYVHALYTCHLS
jgi:hypothetical protein